MEIENYNDIIETIKSLYNNPKLFFLDEIQNLPRWELFVNRLHRQGYNLVLTGSNSNLLSSELATHLTGRYISTIVFPFSFKGRFLPDPLFFLIQYPFKIFFLLMIRFSFRFLLSGLFFPPTTNHTASPFKNFLPTTKAAWYYKTS